MNPKYRIVIGSDPDHDDLVGEIYYEDQIVCVVTQERGPDSLDLEIFGRGDGKPWTFLLADFEDTLAMLKGRLWDLRRQGRGDS